MRTFNAYVNIETTEILDQLPVEDLRRELAARGGDDCRRAAMDAVSLLRRGSIYDAIVLLEREFAPKWASVEDCSAAFYCCNPDGGIRNPLFSEGV